MSLEALLLAVMLTTVTVVIVVVPLLRPPTATASESLTQKQRERLLVYYERVVRNIRDLDEDHALGKISDADYHAERALWAERGVQVLRALDTIGEQTVIAPTPADDAAVDHAIEDHIEAAIRAYRQQLER